MDTKIFNNTCFPCNFIVNRFYWFIYFSLDIFAIIFILASLFFLGKEFINMITSSIRSTSGENISIFLCKIIISLTFTGLLVLCLMIFINKFIYNLKLKNIFIFMNNNNIKIIHKSDVYVISFDKIKHVLKVPKGLTLIWNINNSPITFSISAMYYGSHVVKIICSHLCNHNCFTSDKKEIKRIRSLFGLNKIFRKNRIENIMPLFQKEKEII